MGTRNIKLTGVASWAKVFEENRDMKGFEGAYEDCDGAYTINVLLDSENFDTLKASGSMKKGSMTPEGINVKFVRKHKDRFEWNSGAPTVVDTSDKRWSFENDGQINNGSKVEVYLSVYDTSRPSIKGTRLDKVVVVENAEFVPNSDNQEIPF